MQGSLLGGALALFLCQQLEGGGLAGRAGGCRVSGPLLSTARQGLLGRLNDVYLLQLLDITTL